MKRALLACLFVLPGCSEREPTNDGADDVDTSDSDAETSETTSEGDDISTTGDGDGDTTTTGDGDGDTTTTTGDGDGDTTTGDGDGDTTTGDGDGDTTTTGDGDGDSCPQAGDCNELLSAFATETMAIRGCSDDNQCGQVLQGTSCGCTQDWVALLDADTTCFYLLIEQADLLQCDLGLGSTCDCPEADGYACVDGICTWNYL